MADAVEAAIAASIAEVGGGGDNDGGPVEGDHDGGPVDTSDAGSDADTGGDDADGAGAVAATPGAGGDGDAAKPAAGDDPAKAAAAKKPDEPVDEHDFSKVPERDAAGKINRIPHTRVAKMVSGAVEKALAPVTAERDTLKAHNAEYVKRLENIEPVEDAMFNDAPRFIEMLRQIPGYADLLGQPGATPAGAQPTFDPKDPPPGPDTDTGYSPEGLQKLLDWNASRGAEQGYQRAKKEFEAQFGPVKKAFDSTKQAREHTAQLERSVNSKIDSVAKRPHFKENSEAILKVLADDPGHKTGKFEHDLESAYDLVVFGKLSTDREKIRKEVMDELSKAPRSTGTSGGAQSRAAGVQGSGDPVEDAIRASIRGK